jgi:predicted AAA+ superfamily ATPase
MLFADKCKKVTLDDRDDRLLADSNPRLFLESYGWPLIIDEIQKAPSLLDVIKINIDEQRLSWMREGKERELMYILTGSSRFELQAGISESLAGRCGVVEMASFSQSEKYGYDNLYFEPKLESLRLREKQGRKNIEPRSKSFKIFLWAACLIFAREFPKETYISNHMSIRISSVT